MNVWLAYKDTWCDFDFQNEVVTHGVGSFNGVWYIGGNGMCVHQLSWRLSKQTWPCIELEHGVGSDYVCHNLNSSSLTVNDKTGLNCCINSQWQNMTGLNCCISINHAFSTSFTIINKKTVYVCHCQIFGYIPSETLFRLLVRLKFMSMTIFNKRIIWFITFIFEWLNTSEHSFS